MKCVYHQEQEAKEICVLCGQPVCQQCLVELAGDNYCRQCLEKGLGRLRAPVREAGSGFWTFVFSFIPGGGYMYLGLMKRGLQTLILFFGSIFVGLVLRFQEIIPLALPVIMFYTIFDTRAIWKQMRQGLPVEDEDLLDLGIWEQRGRVVAYVLIVIGALILLNNLFPYYYFTEILFRLLAPLLIIGLGVYILYRNTRKEVGKHE